MKPDFDFIARETEHVETAHRCIKTPIPVPESFPLFQEMEKYEIHANMGQPPVVWHHTEDGYKICDPYGNKWIDFSSAIFITNAGHGNPDIVDAIVKTAQKPMLASFLFATEERVQAAKEYISVCPIPDAKVYMLSAGTEACEMALKVMRVNGVMKNPKKKVIVTMKDSFHGRTLGSQQLGGSAALSAWITSMDPDIIHAPYPTSFEHKWADPEDPDFTEDGMFKSFTDTIDAAGIDYDDICGVFIESYHAPLCYPLPTSYAKRLRKFCDDHDIILGMDEIQIGGCRSGKFWCFMNNDIIPDLFTSAKGSSSSLPQSCLFGRRELLDVFEAQGLTSTHSGSPVCCAASAANIRFLRDNKMWEVAAEKGKIIDKRLHEIKAKYLDRVAYVGGIGMGWSIHFANAQKEPQPEFTREVLLRSMEMGLLFSAPNNHGASLRCMAPLTIPVEALKEGLDVFDAAIGKADKMMPKYE